MSLTAVGIGLRVLHKETVTILGDFGSQIALKTPARLMVTAGNAEISGVTLSANSAYSFSASDTLLKPIVLSNAGAVLEVEVENATCIEHTVGDPFARSVECIHSILRALRRRYLQSETNSFTGPTVLVAGPKGSGKSSTCRTLANYAISDGLFPTLVDFDPGQQGISLPGTLSSGTVTTQLIQGAGVNSFSPTGSFILPFGHVAIEKDYSLYMDQITHMAETLREALRSQQQSLTAGIIINSAGWIKDGGLAALRHMTKTFSVDVVVVIESETLYRDFLGFVKTLDWPVEVVFLKKPVGATEHDTTQRRRSRNSVILNAFLPESLEPPKVFKTSLRRLIFYRISSFHRRKNAIGADVSVSNQNLPPQNFLLNHLMYISWASNLLVDVKKWPIRGYAVLVGFNKATDEAWLVTTLSTESLEDGSLVLICSDCEISAPDGQPFDEYVLQRDA